MNYRKNTIAHMICEGLRYCCLQEFFRRYPSTSMVAYRLGVTPRGVRALKARVAGGLGHCKNCHNCLKGK